MTARERRESRFSRGGSNSRGVSLALTMWKRPESTTRREWGARVRLGSGRDATSASALNKWRAERARASYSLTKSPGLAYIGPSVAAFSRLLFFPGGGVVFRRTL